MKSQEETKGSISAIVAGILVIIAGFLIYNYFTKSEGPQEQITFKETAAEPEALGSETPVPTPAKLEPNEIPEQPPSQLTAEEIRNWRPRVVAKEEVQEGKYTVVKGDTLWNIAEAKYGSGAEWGRILEANKGAIGFLPDGSQARIEIGTVLILP